MSNTSASLSSVPCQALEAGAPALIDRLASQVMCCALHERSAKEATDFWYTCTTAASLTCPSNASAA